MRLINADDMEWLEELEYEYHPEPNGEPWYRVKDVWDCVAKERTIDPSTLRPKGEWIYNTDDFTPKKRCTNCGYNKPIAAGERIEQEPSFSCPNCGADMRPKEA